MSFWSSRKRPPSIVLPRSHLQQLILVKCDWLWLQPLFRISEVVAYESWDYS